MLSIDSIDTLLLQNGNKHTESKLLSISVVSLINRNKAMILIGIKPISMISKSEAGLSPTGI